MNNTKGSRRPPRPPPVFFRTRMWRPTRPCRMPSATACNLSRRRAIRKASPMRCANRKKAASSAGLHSLGILGSISATMSACGTCPTTNRASKWFANTACCSSIAASRFIRCAAPRCLTRSRGIEPRQAGQLVVSKIYRSDRREHGVFRRRQCAPPLSHRRGLGSVCLQGRQYPLFDDERSQD